MSDEKRTEKTEVTTEERKDRWGSPEKGEATEYKKVTKSEEKKVEDEDESVTVDE